MKAYVVDNDQSAGVRFADVPDPNPAPNEALIGVEAFSVNHGELPGAGVFGNSWTPPLPWETKGRLARSRMERLCCYRLDKEV